MTDHKVGLAAADADDVKRHNTRVVVEALKKNAEAVRIVCDIREWLAYQRHLIDSGTDPGSAECVAATALLNSLATLLPRSPERRAEPTGGGEGT